MLRTQGGVQRNAVYCLHSEPLPAACSRMHHSLVGGHQSWASSLFMLDPLLGSSRPLHAALDILAIIVLPLVLLFLGLAPAQNGGLPGSIFHYDSHQPEEKIQLLRPGVSPVCSHLCVEEREL